MLIMTCFGYHTFLLHAFKHLERALGLGEPRTRREGEGPASGSTSDEEELCGQY